MAWRFLNAFLIFESFAATTKAQLAVNTVFMVCKCLSSAGELKTLTIMKFQLGDGNRYLNGSVD